MRALFDTQVIVYVPPAAVPQSARGQAQMLPAAVPSTDGVSRQPVVAEGEAQAQADLHLCAQSEHDLPPGMPPKPLASGNLQPLTAWSGCTLNVDGGSHR